jgi:hypothetical protein
MDLTTLQLAERIALAAVEAFCVLDVDGTIVGPRDHRAAQAVLRALRENHVWLHRTVQDAEGVIDGAAPSEVLPEVEA